MLLPSPSSSGDKAELGADIAAALVQPFKDSPEGGTSFASWSGLEEPGHPFLLEITLQFCRVSFAFP